jgi:hypothetical protein
MHEVGHALGLRHNFRASRAYTEAQLADAEFTRAHGTTGSVMEYNAVNLPRPGKAGGVPFQTTLGPYDYWAIEYAYKPLPPGSTPQAERPNCMRIAARSSEPLLAYGTDEDAAWASTPRPSRWTWAPTRWPLPPSAWPSPATCSGARRRACCRPNATTRCCAAPSPTR